MNEEYQNNVNLDEVLDQIYYTHTNITHIVCACVQNAFLK